MNNIADTLSKVMDDNGVKYKKNELENVTDYANKIYKDISAKCKTCGKDFTIMVKE